MWPKADGPSPQFWSRSVDCSSNALARLTAPSNANGLGLSVELTIASTIAFVLRGLAGVSGNKVRRSGCSAPSELVQMIAILSLDESSREDRKRAISQLAISVAGDANSLGSISRCDFAWRKVILRIVNDDRYIKAIEAIILDLLRSFCSCTDLDGEVQTPIFV